MHPSAEDFSIDGLTSSASFQGRSWNSAAFRRSVPVTPPAEEAADSYFQGTEELRLSAVTEDETPLVAVIGIGYVGLHLITAFARHYAVIAFDISQTRLSSVADQLPKTANLTLTSDASHLTGVTHFLVSVPTLLVPGTSVVDTSCLRIALNTIFAHARVGSTIIIESSVAVGMTRRLLAKMVQERQLKAGMSPEVRSQDLIRYRVLTPHQRVDPGRVSPSFEAIPKIISGLDDLAPGSLSSIRKLYSPIFKTLVAVSSPEVAEITKLYENCQRMICIAYANEMADACRAFATPIDPFEVSRAAATKPFGYLPFSPSAGVGGHCIPVNPHYLFSTSDFPLLRHATEKMRARPMAIGDDTMRKLYSVGRHMKGKPRVLVVGVAFKPGQHVLSNSSGVQIINHLLDYWEADVSFADPLVKEESVPQAPKLDVEREWNQEGLSEFDAIIVVVKQVGLKLDVLERLEGTFITWCCQR